MTGKEYITLQEKITGKKIEKNNPATAANVLYVKTLIYIVSMFQKST